MSICLYGCIHVHEAIFTRKIKKVCKRNIGKTTFEHLFSCDSCKKCISPKIHYQFYMIKCLFHEYMENNTSSADKFLAVIDTDNLLILLSIDFLYNIRMLT